MTKQNGYPEKLIITETAGRLTLTTAHPFRIWGALAFALAAISLIATVWIGIYLIGGAIVLLYVAVGVWLISGRRTVLVDAQEQQVIFLSRYFWAWGRQTQITPFGAIASVYLDFETHAHYSFFRPQTLVRRMWRIYFVLNDRQTATVVRQIMDYSIDQSPNLSRQTAQWEGLTQKICLLTGKLLVKTPGVPGRAPHTFVDVVNQIVQRRLAKLPPDDPLQHRSVYLRSHPNGSLEILIDGEKYRQMSDLPDAAIRDLIQAAVEEWQAG
jgi:hypothetical protein